MNLRRYCLRNFRRLEDVKISLEDSETIFVGANNSGKTSATAAFKIFVSRKSDFKIHDFSAPLISVFDNFGKTGTLGDGGKLPSIEMDLWFSFSPETEYGQVGHLLPSLETEFTEVGIRICFLAAVDPITLRNEYLSAYPITKPDDSKYKQKPLSYFLSQGSNLKRYYELNYFIIEKNPDPKASEDYILHAMKKEDGQNALKSLLHIDYVDAQRNIDDNNSERSKRLSTVFSDFYKHNLEKKPYDNESINAIDESNKLLNEHYAEKFSPLLDIIRDLGFPAIHDRDLQIITKLTPEEALNTGADLVYVELGTNHHLPEAYNGLGFKNLIYLTIQVAHYQIRWAAIENNRPFCHLILIEEPEVHLHAQVQQVFISRIGEMMKKIRANSGCSSNSQQLVITTHSSHIVAEADFKCIRYFRRKESSLLKSSKFIASEVLNLAHFDEKNSDEGNKKFLKKFLKLTHCNLFFADAALLVEGTVEKLLMPRMIEKTADSLKKSYLTTLELGGAYAHRFTPLLKFINLPSLVITDLDSVDPTSREACRADQPNAVTSNATIKDIIKNKESIPDLLNLSEKERTTDSNGYQQYIAFQNKVPTPQYGTGKEMTPRTFEEAFIYENLDAVRSKKIEAFIKLDNTPDFEKDHTLIFDKVRSSNYKKVEFALNQIGTDTDWVTPKYISDGLKWLSKIIIKTSAAEAEQPSSEKVSGEDL
jgi:predicted ATP-dependent endonuclease of OLD family